MNFSLKKSLRLVFIFFLTGSKLYAQVEKLNIPHYEPEKMINQSFVAPNEANFREAIFHLTKVRPGVFISIGSERSFLNLAYATQATEGLFIDRDPEIIKFHHMNIKLLIESENLHDYQSLRFQDDMERWKKLGFTSEDCSWWKRVVLNKKNEMIFLNEEPNKKLTHHAFKDANYIYDETAYNRLSTLAKSNKLKAMMLDISNREGIVELASQFKSFGMIASAIDISNAWSEKLGYLKEKELVNFIEIMSEVTSPSSLLIVTGSRAFNYLDEDSLEMGLQIDRRFTNYLYQEWNYHAFTFSLFKNREEIAVLARILNGSEIYTPTEFSGKINLNRNHHYHMRSLAKIWISSLCKENFSFLKSK